MLTRILIMRPELPHETREVTLAENPGYDALKALITPILDGAPLEHVAVLADFSGGTNYERADMFVDEVGRLTGLPRNEAATQIYRRASLRHDPRQNPEDLPWIAGTAILFDRLVWR